MYNGGAAGKMLGTLIGRAGTPKSKKTGCGVWTCSEGWERMERALVRLLGGGGGSGLGGVAGVPKGQIEDGILLDGGAEFCENRVEREVVSSIRKLTVDL